MKSVSANPTAQEVLTHEFRQPMTTTPTVPGRRSNRHHRSGRQLIRWGWGWGTLMRHFLLSGSVTALPFGVRVTTAPAGLIAAAGSTHRLVAGLFSTLRGAVAMAAITRAADEYRRATAGAAIASSWKFHGHTGPMGSSRERPLCGILRVQRCPSGLRGATTELAWRLGPVSRLRFHWPVSVLPHR